MQKPQYFLQLLVMLLLVSCSPTTPILNITQIATATPTAQITSIPPTISTSLQATSLPLVESTRTNTVVPSLENNMEYQPLETLSELPPGISIPGTLVIRSDPDYLLNFADQTPQYIQDIRCLSASPNGQWLAYCKFTDDLPDGQLIVQDVNGNIQQQLPMEKNWQHFATSIWLDNEWLVFNVRGGSERILPVVVVNPFTGEQQEFPSKYPNIQPESLGPVSSVQFHFLYTSVVYHPSLKLAIYPEYTDEGFFVVLWDREAQQALARVKDLDEFLHVPRWSPDGSRFVVAVTVQTNDPGRAWIEEYFEVSQEGQVAQITHFADFFTHAQIGSASWSPDGWYLAFWLATNPSECGEGQHLAIMELRTRQITNTCIPGSEYYDAPNPVWSLDSQYLATVSFIPNENTFRMILVDIEQGWAAEIGENASPIGWLVSP